MTIITIVGDSEPKDFQILNNGVVLNGAGLTVGIVLPAEAPALTAAWLDQAAGKVRVTGHEQLQIGSYYFRFTLTDGSGQIGFAPNVKKADKWTVVPVM
jgi:hypothetical protein